MLYRIEYAPEAERHFRFLTVRQRAIVQDEVQRHLAYQPNVETRNRKPMRTNPLAPWELRVGEFRIYYEAKGKPEGIVQVLAIGIKLRDKIHIGKEIIKL